MASRLEAAIAERFGLEARLIVGHDAIFEVTVEGEVVYTNGSACSVFPEHAEIFAAIAARGGVALAPPSPEVAADPLEDGPACPLPRR